MKNTRQRGERGKKKKKRRARNKAVDCCCQGENVAYHRGILVYEYWRYGSWWDGTERGLDWVWSIAHRESNHQ